MITGSASSSKQSSTSSLNDAIAATSSPELKSSTSNLASSNASSASKNLSMLSRNKDGAVTNKAESKEHASVSAGPKPAPPVIVKLARADGVYKKVNTHDRPTHDRPTHSDRPTHDRPNHDRPTHDRSTHDRPSHDRPTHERPDLKRPAQDHEQEKVILLKTYFLTLPSCFYIPIFFSNFDSNFSDLLDMRNLQEQVNKHSVTKNWSDLLLFE